MGRQMRRENSIEKRGAVSRKERRNEKWSQERMGIEEEGRKEKRRGNKMEWR